MTGMNVLVKVKAEVGIRMMIQNARQLRNKAYNTGRLEMIRDVDNLICDLYRAERYLWTGAVR